MSVCESCRLRPAVVSVTFEDGVTFAVCNDCEPA
jgi:protein-arginine kinase activator protein McsA